MSLILEAINKPGDAFKRNSKNVSWLFVIITILVVTVFDPIVNYIVNINNFEVSINVYKILWLCIAGILTYLSFCSLLWLVCRVFGSETPFMSMLNSWGITYFPNIICAVIVALAETFFYIFWNNSLWGMLLSIIFIGILIWKVMLYLLFLREVANLRGKRLFGAFMLCGLIIFVLALINMFLGLKTPII